MTGAGAGDGAGGGTAGADLDLARLASQLRGTPFEGRVVLHAALGSTIDSCRRLADAGAAEGTVVLADAQSEGRGQHGRRWHSPAGAGLYLSALLRPQVAAANADLLTALAGLAAEGTLREAAGLDVLLKLPNDLLVAAPCGAPGPPWRKVGGVLVDTAVQGPSVRHAIVSLGLNVHPPAAGWPAPLSGLVTSLAEHVPGVTWRRDDLAAAFLRKLLDVARELAGAESAGAESADGAGGRAADGAGGRAGDGEAAAAIRARHAALAREVPDFELPRP